MNDYREYGKQVAVALEAVKVLHADTSRLLLDCDKIFGTGESIFGNGATRELTYNVRAQHWMAHSVYRFYPAKGDQNVAEGVTVCFFDCERSSGAGRISEPCIVIGRVAYADGRKAVEACLDGEGWDLWHALFEWGEPTVGPIIRQVDMPDPRVQRVTFVVLPLFEIASIDDVQGWLERVRDKAVS